MNNRNSFIGNLVSIGLLAIFLVLAFFLVKAFFVFIYKYSFIFLIVSLLVNYKVAGDYIKSLGQLFKREPIYGFGATALSVIFHPVVFLVWMFRAIFSRSIGRVTNPNDGIFSGQARQDDVEFTDYEEVEEDFELKEIEKKYRDQ